MRFLLILMLAVCFSCSKNNNPNYMDCWDDIIAEQSPISCNFTYTIDEYEFQGEIVILVPAVCVDDGADFIYDSNCQELGWVNGFIGKKEINGVDFFAEAKFIRVVHEFD